MKKAIALLILTLFSSACAVGPNYKRPKVDVPGMYRGAAGQGEETQAQQNPTQRASSPGTSPQESQASAKSFGDQKRFDVFQDPTLQQLIRTALQNNYDVRIAAARILEARAQLGITRADQLPTRHRGWRNKQPLSKNSVSSSI